MKWKSWGPQNPSDVACLLTSCEVSGPKSKRFVVMAAECQPSSKLSGPSLPRGTYFTLVLFMRISIGASYKRIRLPRVFSINACTCDERTSLFPPIALLSASTSTNMYIFTASSLLFFLGHSTSSILAVNQSYALAVNITGANA